jgi:hypothetical protein
MPRGDKSSYSSKQKRQAEHIEEGYEKRGTSKKEAERRAWATVNKQDKGAKRAVADAEKNPAMRVPAKVDAKAAKRRKNRDRSVRMDSPQGQKSLSVIAKSARKNRSVRKQIAGLVR